jgi:hypothetical protein
MLPCIARRAVLAFCLVCGLCRGQQNTPDSATYASFFRQIVQFAQLKSGEKVLLNGQDTGLIQQSVQQSMSLTDGETETLRNVSVVCLAKIRSFDGAVRPLVLEVRRWVEKERRLLSPNFKVAYYRKSPSRDKP